MTGLTPPPWLHWCFLRDYCASRRAKARADRLGRAAAPSRSTDHAQGGTTRGRGEVSLKLALLSAQPGSTDGGDRGEALGKPFNAD